MSSIERNLHGTNSSPASDGLKQTPGEDPCPFILIVGQGIDPSLAGSGYLAPELIPPVLKVTTEIEASKQQAAWSAVDGHILPHHTVGFFCSFRRFRRTDSYLECRSLESVLVRLLHRIRFRTVKLTRNRLYSPIRRREDRCPRCRG